MASSSSQSGVERGEGRDLSVYLPLYKAALRGDWGRAKSFLDRDRRAVTTRITSFTQTALHVAVATGRSVHFVEKLLELIPEEELETLTEENGNTALHTAATFGNTEAAKLLVAKRPSLPNTWSKEPGVPLYAAALHGQREMVLYLLTVTKADTVPSPFADLPGFKLLVAVIVAEFYDVALQLVQRYPRMGTLESHNSTALRWLAEKDSAFLSGSRLNFWQLLVYSCIPVKLENFSDKTGGGDVENPGEGSQVHARRGGWVQFFRGNHSISVCQKLQAILWEVIQRLAPHFKHLKDKKLMHHQTLQLVKCFCTDITRLDNSKAASIFRPPILLAASSGVHEIVEEIVESFPAVISSQDHHGHNIFHLAVMNRYENVFNLLYQMSEQRHLVTMARDINGNTILHLAGNLAPVHRLNLVSGAVLQMQRELRWYQEVEKFLSPNYRRWRNSDGKTPAVVFTEGHKELVKEAEKWMKDTANSFTFVATIIATVAFAASITVPGGNNDDNGLPVLNKEAAFNVYSISNTISLFSSTAFLLIFLSILTTRYAESDFLYALPNKLITGLIFLFLSITSMLVTFGATLYLTFGHKSMWVLITVGALASVPTALFISLQFPLLLDLLKTTYGPRIFGKESERFLY